MEKKMRAERMREILEKELSPSMLVIRDESARHKGHAEAAIKGNDVRGPQQISETHYKIKIISKKFNDMTLIERHRLVHLLLKKEFLEGLHALSLTLKGECEV